MKFGGILVLGLFGLFVYTEGGAIGNSVMSGNTANNNANPIQIPLTEITYNCYEALLDAYVPLLNCDLPEACEGDGLSTRLKVALTAFPCFQDCQQNHNVTTGGYCNADGKCICQPRPASN